MNLMPSVHPTDDLLAAFGLGRVDDATALSVATHLETCADCRRVVAVLSVDPFLNQLRAVGTPDGTPAPEKPVDGLARSISHPRPTPTAADTIPGELSNHPNYEVVRELGRGGMGVVYLARNRLMDRPEVLKVMNKDLVKKPGAADRFLREMRSAAKLAHPNVVRAYSADWLGDALMFAMEYVEGNDLAGLVKDRGPLPVLNACYYVQQVAAGLQHAFENGMVHRDIKPANLILARFGKKHTVKILDFGLAKVKGGGRGGELTGDGAAMGTPQYMAPEQWRDAATADIRADIYSLGCTLYFLLTGTSPFSGNLEGLLWKHLQAEPEPLTRVRPAVPAEVAAVVAKMMAKDPTARYQTPAEVAKALAPFVKPGAKPAPTAGPTTPEAKSMPARMAPLASATQSDSRPVWETIGDVSVLPVVAQPAPPARKRRWLWPAVACGTVLAALLVASVGGVFKAKTPNGTIVVENVPPDAEVTVNGETVAVTRNGETVTLTALKDGQYKLRVMQDGKELKLNEGEITLAGKPVIVRVERVPPPLPPPGSGPPAAPTLAPEKSEWAGSGLVKIDGEERWIGGAWTFTERRGQAFKVLWRAGFGGRRAVFEGVVDSSGRITVHSRQWTAPEAKPPETFKGTGEVGANRMTLALEEPTTGVTARIDFKRLPDGGEGFKFQGRWQCIHRPKVWSGFRNITATTVTTDGFQGSGPWQRDGGLIIAHFPNGGREALIIDPDKPNELTGSNGDNNGKVFVTWVRQ